MLGKRELECDLSALLIRFDHHVAAKVAGPLPHTSDANAGALRLHVGEFLGRDSLTFVLYLERDAVDVASDTD